MTQKEIFSGGEGDAWFARNHLALEDSARLRNDPILYVMEANAVVPRKILEVGASNGFRLHEIQERHGCEAHALELSEMAIADGRSKYPQIRFQAGSAEKLPFADGQFDCLIMNAVLHWLDRSCLLTALAEIDRVLANEGFFLLGDFSPSYPQKVPYHHRPEENIYTYKLKYHEVLLATGNYVMTAWQVFDHETMKPSSVTSGNDAYGVCLLRKELGVAYALKTRVG